MMMASLLQMGTLLHSFSIASAFSADKLNALSLRKSFTRSLSVNNLLGKPRDASYSKLDPNDGKVIVVVKRKFPTATPHEARNAWMEYHWKRGGGLPIFIRSNGTTEEVFERTIYPVFMKETLRFNPCDEDASIAELSYNVSETGPFYQDVIDNSHFALLTFRSLNTGCEMVWNVTFYVSRWAGFYKLMTQILVGASANTVREVLSAPRVFQMSTRIESFQKDAKSARDECLDFIWMQGGGLPLPPALSYGETLQGSSTRRNLLRIPPLITESIIDTFDSENMSGFEYALNSPGWLTFPFLMHTHRGTLNFVSKDDNSLSINWKIEIRPYTVAAPIVEKLVEMTVSTLARNLLVRLTEPGSTVTIKPPRGNTDLLMSMEDFGSVPKDTWLGGVLDAHLRDKRPTTEQIFAALSPWTWGRSGNGDKTDVINFHWS